MLKLRLVGCQPELSDKNSVSEFLLSDSVAKGTK